MFYHYFIVFSFLLTGFVYPYTSQKEVFKSPYLLTLILVLTFFLIFFSFILKNKNLKKIILSLFFLPLIFLFFHFQYAKEDPGLKHIKINKKENYLILGKIESINGFKGNYYEVKIFLEKLFIKEKLENKEVWPLKENFKPTFVFIKSRFKLENLKIGNRISFSPYFIRDADILEKSGYKNYLLQEKIKYFVYVEKNKIKVIDSNSSLIAEFREKILININQYISFPSNGLVYGLLTGNKNYLPTEAKENFRKTGTYHVLAVSGMHAGLLLLIAFSVLRMLGLRKYRALAIIVFLVLPFYLVVTDFQISIVRTYIMTFLFLSLKFFDKKTSLAQVLLITFIGMLIISPEELHKISFQLSFTAVWGIALSLEVIKKYQIKNKFISFMIVSLFAQFSTSAIVIYYFGYFNFLGLFYNIIVTLLIPLIFLYSLFFMILPFESLKVIWGNFISFMSEVTFFLLDFTRLDLRIYDFSALKEKLVVAILIFLIFHLIFYFIMEIFPYFFRKKSISSHS